jgi:hypothetical protein
MQVSGAERIWVLRGRGVRAVIPRRDISNVVLAGLHPRYAVAALLGPKACAIFGQELRSLYA